MSHDSDKTASDKTGAIQVLRMGKGQFFTKKISAIVSDIEYFI
jgi:hypothetical protein